MFIDYVPCEECVNPDTFGMICVKCGECGRQFTDAGVCVNIQDHKPYYGRRLNMKGNDRKHDPMLCIKHDFSTPYIDMLNRCESRIHPSRKNRLDIKSCFVVNCKWTRCFGGE